LTATVNTAALMNADNIASGSFKLYCYFRHLGPEEERAYQ